MGGVYPPMITSINPFRNLGNLGNHEKKRGNKSQMVRTSGGKPAFENTMQLREIYLDFLQKKTHWEHTHPENERFLP